MLGVSDWLNHLDNLSRDTQRLAPHIAFPNPDNLPAELPKRARHPSIAFAISFDFCDPVGSIPSGRELALSLRPTASVPEVAIAENRDLTTPNHKVWAAGEIFCVQAEA